MAENRSKKRRRSPRDSGTTANIAGVQTTITVSTDKESYRKIYEKLLSRERLRPTTDEIRRERKDYDFETLSDRARIVRSSPFRRLQSKAQVFSMARSGDVRTRLTHSIEVADYGALIAETLARELVSSGSLPEELRFPFIQTVENACLLHDIGNPPFGHMGEHAIQEWFSTNKRRLKTHWIDLNELTGEEAERHLKAYANFDGNPQGFRIAVRLQLLNDEFGMNLTCALLASYLKYLGDQPDDKVKFRKKIGYFPSEAEVVQDVWGKLKLPLEPDGRPQRRHPLAYLMEAADDIAFCLSDIEDALERSIVSEDKYLQWMLAPEISNPQLQRAIARAEEIKAEAATQALKLPLVKNGTYHLFRLNLSKSLVTWAVEAYIANEDRVLNGSMATSLLDANPEARRLLEAQKEFCSRYVYTSREAINTELAGLNAIKGLLNAYEKIIFMSTKEFEELSNENSRDRLKKYPIDSLLFTLLPEKHRLFYQWCKKREPKLEPVFRTQLIVDYISGMTDSHVLKIFNMINGTQQFGVE
jgi:dGTPase